MRVTYLFEVMRLGRWALKNDGSSNDDDDGYYYIRQAKHGDCVDKDYVPCSEQTLPHRIVLRLRLSTLDKVRHSNESDRQTESSTTFRG